jgi:16S rRNA pseudouridine516 synthase
MCPKKCGPTRFFRRFTLDVPGTPQRLDRLLSNLGYCSRREVFSLLRDGIVTHTGGQKLRPDTRVLHHEILFDAEPLDPPIGVVLMLNKPVGYSCTFSGDEGETIYNLLPERFRNRNPKLASVGRLDKDTSGLLLLTDDGTFLHKVTSPHHKIEKCYEATLADPLKGSEAGIFSSGTVMLEGEEEPLKPARLEVLGHKHVRVVVTEGRYHQVRRMFAYTGNKVETLTRIKVGALELGELEEGSYRVLTEDEKRLVLG